MTDYPNWDAKAAALARQAEEEEAEEKAECDKELGLEGGPKGPPTVEAEKQLGELGGHSKNRQEFIDWSKSREVSLTHSAADSPVELSGSEVDGKAIRLADSVDVTYVIPEGAGLLKLMADRCKRVRIQVQSTLLTSCVEVCRCSDFDLDLSQPVGTLQVDECTDPVRVRFAERDHVGRIYHQNSPGLAIGWGSSAADGAEELHTAGIASHAQMVTVIGAGEREPLRTVGVRRGEGEYPIDLPTMPGAGPAEQPEPEAAPAAEERARLAEEKRLAGNDMFRANDFMQAALQYTEAIRLDPNMSSCLANRAQCWLKVGDHDKALDDAIRCTEVDPANPKGWFRKGMALHAMKKYHEAIPALLEAEKLEPANKQIPEAIKMAQLMARRAASS